MSKRPWRSHYTKDWRTDPFVRSLDLECRAFYFELLDIAWDEGGLLAEWIESGTYLAQQIGITRRKFASCWIRVRAKFEECSPGVWSNPRLERERVTADSVSENQRNKAIKRWSGDAVALPTGTAPAMPFTVTTQSHKEEREKEPPPVGVFARFWASSTGELVPDAYQLGEVRKKLDDYASRSGEPTDRVAVNAMRAFCDEVSGWRETRPLTSKLFNAKWSEIQARMSGKVPASTAKPRAGPLRNGPLPPMEPITESTTETLP